jgi:GTP-binding protein SAR1
LVTDVPILILGNKIDKHGAASDEELKNFFGLNLLVTGKVSQSVSRQRFAPNSVRITTL